MSKILIVEDEAQLARFVELELIHEGYSVDKAEDGRTGLELAISNDYDLILLDVMLPGINGFEVLRRVRTQKETPVILLTARYAVMDKVSGLDAGADDYITKPFAIEELLARIRVALKRKSGSSAASTRQLSINNVTIDLDRHEVSAEGNPVELTNYEFELLRILMENRNIVLDRERLISEIWGYDYDGETNVVDVYIRHLRTKIDDKYGISLIRTVRGVGYVIKEGSL